MYSTAEVDFRPLSEEPKIANFRNGEVELIALTEEESCRPMALRDLSVTPLFAVLDVSNSEFPQCTFQAKMQNLRFASLNGLILVTNDGSFVKNHCRMYDDNHFFSGVMDSGNLTLLKKYQAQGQKGDDSFLTRGVISIQLVNSKDKLVEVWVSSLNSQSYTTLSMLGQALKSMPNLEHGMQWTPRFATFGCTHGESKQVCATNDYIASCGCRGEFCSPEVRQKTPAPMVQEDIRQLLIFKQYGTRYLQYAELFARGCLEKYRSENYIEECATKVMERLGIDSYSINQIVGQFLDECSEDEAVKDSELYESLERDQRAFHSYEQYPLLLVNKQIVLSL
jgi:hypothetical protein